MTALAYKKIALDWQPTANSSRSFHKIVIVVFILAFLAAIPLTFVKVPPSQKHEKSAVPERIADFIAKKEKPPVKPPKPLDKPKPPPKQEPKPVDKPEPIQEVTRQRDVERKPLTDSEKKARKVAENSGLLALSHELNDLIDTKDVNATLGKKLNTNAASNTAANEVAGLSTDAITSNVAATGGKVNVGQYAAKVGGTALEGRTVNAELAARASKEEAKAAEAGKKRSGVSAEEDVTLVFDKNKGALYSLYERERRTTQGLQGKIVLQLTISPSGDVIDVKIISSELNSPELESRILSRVKTFKFNISETKPITVTYPIEFLPS